MYPGRNNNPKTNDVQTLVKYVNDLQSRCSSCSVVFSLPKYSLLCRIQRCFLGSLDILRKNPRAPSSPFPLSSQVLYLPSHPSPVTLLPFARSFGQPQSRSVMDLLRTVDLPLPSPVFPAPIPTINSVDSFLDQNSQLSLVPVPEPSSSQASAFALETAFSKVASLLPQLWGK